MRRLSLLAAAAALLLLAPAAAAQYPGRNGLLAYMGGDFHLHTLNLSTGALRDLGPGYDPSWSPDGGRLLFGRDSGGGGQLWVSNADGSSDVLLDPTFTWSGSGTWTPDGTSLLVAGSRGGTIGLWRIAPDGTGATLVIPGEAYGPSFSPDGSRFVYSFVPAGADDDVRADLWIANADGTGRHRLTTGGFDVGADWTPDGTRITYRHRRQPPLDPACASYPGAAIEVVRTIRPDGLGVVRLSAGPCESTMPAVAPDGSRVVFGTLTDAPGLRFELYTAAPGGGPLSGPLSLGVPDSSSPFQTLAWQSLPVGLAKGVVRAGSRRADVLRGGLGPDVLSGGAGADRLGGRQGNDIILGGPGNDRIYAGAGRDYVSAGAGDDLIDARDGRRDVIVGGPGRDTAVVDRFDVVRGVEVVRRG